MIDFKDSEALCPDFLFRRFLLGGPPPALGVGDAFTRVGTEYTAPGSSLSGKSVGRTAEQSADLSQARNFFVNCRNEGRGIHDYRCVLILLWICGEWARHSLSAFISKESIFWSQPGTDLADVKPAGHAQSGAFRSARF